MICVFGQKPKEIFSKTSAFTLHTHTHKYTDILIMPLEQLAPPLNLNDCKQIVQKINQETKNNLHVDAFFVTSAAEAKGFLGEYFHLKIQCIKYDKESEVGKNNFKLIACLRGFP